MDDDQPTEQDKADSLPLRPKGYTSRLPQELVDFVVDNVSDRHLDQIGAFRNLAPLRACSLVAEGWMKRAQRRIFEWIELPDRTALYSPVETLRASPHLASYTCSCYPSRDEPETHICATPQAACRSYPIVLGGLLPKLRCVAIGIRLAGAWSLVQVERGESEAALRDTSRPFVSFLPIHPRFPLRLSAFSSLEELDLGFVRFQNFYDFAQTLYDFQRLRGPALCVYLEIPRDGKVSLREVERHA